MVDSNLLDDGAADDDHGSGGVAGGLEAVEVEAFIQQGLDGGHDDGHVLGLAAGHDGVDGDGLDGGDAVAGRHDADDVEGVPSAGVDHALDRILGGRDDGEAVGPAVLVILLDGVKSAPWTESSPVRRPAALPVTMLFPLCGLSEDGLNDFSGGFAGLGLGGLRVTEGVADDDEGEIFQLQRCLDGVGEADESGGGDDHGGLAGLLEANPVEHTARRAGASKADAGHHEVGGVGHGLDGVRVGGLGGGELGLQDDLADAVFLLEDLR